MNLVGAVILATISVGVSAQVQDDAAIVKDFQQRIHKYVSLQNKQGSSQTQSNSATLVKKQKHDTRTKIQEARPDAAKGDIFTPEIATYFKKQIATTLNGPDGKKIRVSLRHAEPLPNVQLQANQPYPKDLPLQSTPPSLLANLPPLPKGLQYRVVGPTLIIYDQSSGLVVDLISGAMP